jgi:CheY-like chemotaxis protein
MARLSHELRTPMNAVLGFAQLLQTDTLEPPSARQQARLQRIAEAGARMMSLVDDLLQLAALDTVALAPAPPSAAGATFTVLCIEDHPVNLMLVRELLSTRAQVVLHEATDGKGGIEAARRHRPDLVLLDLQLPDVHGLEVLRTLREDPLLHHCRFVALTANAMPDQVDEALAAGFDDYWTKPIDFGRFLAGIDRLAQAAQLQGASRSRTHDEPSSR